MRHADDGLSVHSQDPVAHLQLPTPVRGAALDDASYFMGHSWRQAITRWLSTAILKKDVKTALMKLNFEVERVTCGIILHHEPRLSPNYLEQCGHF